jgi:hypothetical protein
MQVLIKLCCLLPWHYFHTSTLYFKVNKKYFVFQSKLENIFPWRGDIKIAKGA